MILNPVYGDATPVTCAPMFKRLWVGTINNPTTPVVVTINGVKYTSVSNLTLTARGSVCWTGVINLTSVGLVANKRYAWTVTQGANTDSGSYFHAPAKGTDWLLLFLGCDNNTTFSNDAGAFPECVAGFHEHYKTLFDTGVDIAGALAPDDLGYVGNVIIDDSATSAYGNNSGLKSSVAPANVAATQADYYIGWCALFGMLGPRGQFTTDGTARYSDNAWLLIMWARETNRAFVRKNINTLGQMGDWEFRQDHAWDSSPRKGTYAGKYALGKAAWDAFYGLGQPPNTVISASDTTANHWVNELGDLTIVAPDSITNAERADWIAGTGNEVALPNGGSPADYSTAPTQFTVIYGTNQINDIKTAVSVLRNPFCIFGMGNGVRYCAARTAINGVYNVLTAPGVTEWNFSGSQHTIFDHCPHEWKLLMTDMGTGLMANKLFNGSHACGLFLHSDWHHQAVYLNNHPAYAGNLAENFYSIYHGTTNGSTNFTPPTISTEGVTVGSSTYIAYMDNVTDGGDHNFGGCIISIFGSASPKRMDVSLRDKNNTEVWEKSFSPAYEIQTTVKSVSGASASRRR